jgi:hypothetical protein
LDVTVARANFIDALTALGSAPNKRAVAAQIYRDGSELVFSMGGAEHAIRFSGLWLDRAHIPASFIRGLARKPPSDDPVAIFVRDGRLHVATSSIDCRVTGCAGMSGQAHPDPDGESLPSLFDTYGADNMERARILAELELTQKRARAAIAEAARLLRPFGISEDQIWRLAIANYEAKHK